MSVNGRWQPTTNAECTNCNGFKGITRDVPTTVASGTTNPQPTNGDRMRMYSDEEIAHSRVEQGCVLFNAKDIPNEFFDTYEEAYKAELDWLHQPASFSWPPENGMSSRGHENIGEDNT